MSRIRSKDTKPEMAVRRFLYRSGFRYRLNVRKLPGTPDIVLRKYHTAIFVNGCFWHGHAGCRYFVMPKTNVGFWRDKIERNIRRDEVCSELLRAMGWKVVTVWECELKGDRREATLAALEERIRKNLEEWKFEREVRRARKREEAERLREAKARYDRAIAELGVRIPDSVRRESALLDE